MGREARLICRAMEVFMQWQSRQQLKFQALLSERAHCFRHNLSENERILWSRISGKQLGVAFRRQFPVGKYIVDFVAPSAKLIVEVDDRSHELRRTADARRDRDLGRLGYRVLRIDAELVRRNVAEAVARIMAVLQVGT
jgi:very-short-patch-repair endonuclease